MLVLAGASDDFVAILKKHCGRMNILKNNKKQ